MHELAVVHVDANVPIVAPLAKENQVAGFQVTLFDSFSVFKHGAGTARQMVAEKLSVGQFDKARAVHTAPRLASIAIRCSVPATIMLAQAALYLSFFFLAVVIMALVPVIPPVIMAATVLSVILISMTVMRVTLLV